MDWRRFIGFLILGAAGAFVASLVVGKALSMTVSAIVSVLPLIGYLAIFAYSLSVMIRTKFGWGKTWEDSGKTYLPTGWGASSTGFVAYSLIKLAVVFATTRS